jgi:hypothetical protein
MMQSAVQIPPAAPVSQKRFKLKAQIRPHDERGGGKKALASESALDSALLTKNKKIKNPL